MSRDSVQISIIVLLFLCLGLVILFSASAVAAEQGRHDDPAHFLKKQGLWAVLGLGVLIVTSRIPFEFWQKARLPLFALTILLLGLVLIPGIGSSINGARRWLYAGGWFFQPSELAKLTAAFFVAGHLAADPERAKKFGAGFLPAFGAVLLTSALIVVEPDLGTALFIGVVMMTTLVVSGVRMWHLLPPVALGCAAVGAYVATHLDHVTARLRVYFNPEFDPLGKGHQIKQSLIALGAGSWWGTGLGAGTQKLYFLPEVHSDFIFPVIGEELGFLGAVSVLLLYVAFGVVGWRIVRSAPTPFAFLLSFAIVLYIVLQAAINIMVVTALVPTKGIPLPFLSSGGSSLCLVLAGVGILINISNRTSAPGKVEA